MVGGAVKPHVFEKRHHSTGAPGVDAAALGDDVEVVEHVEEGRARLVYGAYDRSATTRQRPQKFDALLRCHDI